MAIPNKIGMYHFNNVDFLKNAMTHSSYANENKLQSNERLEFLGDAILSFISAEYLYNNYTNLPEGELTKIRSTLVCEQSLYQASLKMKLNDFLLLGNGEELNGGRKRISILADAVEATLAAVYLDGGIQAAKDFALSFILPEIKNVQDGHAPFHDYKTILQEIVQKNREEVLKYVLEEERGPAHDRWFKVQLFLNSNCISSGEGKSKKEAEQNAAKAALDLMGESI